LTKPRQLDQVIVFVMPKCKRLSPSILLFEKVLGATKNNEVLHMQSFRRFNRIFEKKTNRLTSLAIRSLQHVYKFPRLGPDLLIVL